MNWIKITPETELPKERVLGVYKIYIDKDGISHYDYAIGNLYRHTDGVVYIAFISGCTHYCIITNPEN